MITHQYLSSAYTIVVNNQLAEQLFIITAILTITDNLTSGQIISKSKIENCLN